MSSTDIPTRAATTPPTAASDDEQITALLAARRDALRAGDVEGLVASYAADIVSFDLAPPLRSTGAAVRDPEPHRAWLSTFQGPVSLDVTELAVTVGGDVAFCHGLQSLTATPRGATEPFTLWHRVTYGLRRVDGTWQVTHEHTSTPFHMDGSFRAAVELQP